MNHKVIFRGATKRPWFSIVDENGAAVDMTVSGRYLLLRLTKVGQSSPSLTRSTATSAHVAWTSQSGGTGRFVIARGDTVGLDVGRYNLEVFYVDSTITHPVWGPEEWRVEDPATGSL